MPYTDYTTKVNDARRQHNIMVLVGNGFDIQALSDLNVRGDTKYTSFYYFLKSRSFNTRNLIYVQMSKLEADGAENWSDVEGAIDQLNRAGTPVAAITDAMHEIQSEFGRFLDQLVTPSTLAQLSDQTVAYKMTLASLMEFLGDLGDPVEYSSMSLPAIADIGDIYNFLFINFNYTSMLDNYLYLDKTQFVPHPYIHSDRQTDFHPNPRGHNVTLLGPRTKCERQGFSAATYLATDILHPHGTQSTPRSLLFGIDPREDDKSGHELSKPYWAQNERKYADLFPDTNLFIIFGTSLGSTDRWWWLNILSTLQRQDVQRPDILIYWYNDTGTATQASVRDRLIEASGLPATDELRQAVTAQVRIILYDNTTPRAFLNTNPDLIPNWIHPNNQAKP